MQVYSLSMSSNFWLWLVYCWKTSWQWSEYQTEFWSHYRALATPLTTTNPWTQRSSVAHESKLTWVVWVFVLSTSFIIKTHPNHQTVFRPSKWWRLEIIWIIKSDLHMIHDLEHIVGGHVCQVDGHHYWDFLVLFVCKFCILDSSNHVLWAVHNTWASHVLWELPMT